jgi:hypothetical protein
VASYNHVVHRICSKLKFCDKEPTDANKIEKHYLLCFHLIEYCSSNTRLIITRFILNLFMHCLMQKNMINFLRGIIVSALLVQRLFLRFIIYRVTLWISSMDPFQRTNLVNANTTRGKGLIHIRGRRKNENPKMTTSVIDVLIFVFCQELSYY